MSSTHFMVRSEIQTPIFNEFELSDWVGELLQKLNMKPSFGPISKHSKSPGKEAIVTLAAIDDGYLAGSIWYGCVPAIFQLDLYTPEPDSIIEEVVFEHLKPLKPLSMDFKYIDRLVGLTTVSAGTLF